MELGIVLIVLGIVIALLVNAVLGAVLVIAGTLLAIFRGARL